jgi:hypothetical protein
MYNGDKLKSILTLTTGVNCAIVIKTFSSALMKQKNKLERLFTASCFQGKA